MIVSLRGVYRGRGDDGIIVDVGGVGYEVIVPPIVEQGLAPLEDGRPLDLKVSYLATRDNPTPALFGFARDEERKFWMLLKSVPRVGPRGAARAMVLPISTIAQAIREQNVRLIDSLPGISAAGAEKMVATLRQKVAAYAAMEDSAPAASAPADDDELKRLATDLLVEMGIKRPEAVREMTRLLKSHPELRAVEDLIMEYFRQGV